jgi:hypothetical protein
MLKITINLDIMWFCYMETAIKKAPIDKRIEAFEVVSNDLVFHHFHCFRLGSNHVEVINSARKFADVY